MEQRLQPPADSQILFRETTRYRTILINIVRRLFRAFIQYTVKKVIDFPIPSRDVTNQILPGRVINLFPARERLVSDISAGDGKIDILFYSV
jgi:hypothetical protein